MRHTNQGRRSRGRSQNRMSYTNKNQVYDSQGPTQRVRGTAQQIFEKYSQMARDAASAGNHLLAESFQQHSEHYLRIHNYATQSQQAYQKQQEERRQRQQEGGNGRHADTESSNESDDSQANGESRQQADAVSYRDDDLVMPLSENQPVASPKSV